jgi:PleD family two-component response regulator
MISSIDTPTILIVDDERNLRLMLSHAMQNEGYQVMEASNGAVCLSFCQQQLPDLILLDAVMPELNGFACCAELHHQLGDRCPPILMITALADSASVDQAFAAGAIDYVTKPIHWAVLRQRVKQILQMNLMMAELREAKAELQWLRKNRSSSNVPDQSASKPIVCTSAPLGR